MEEIKNEKYPNCAGIYKLTCNKNGKIYIGKSVNLYNRLGDHRRCSNRGVAKCYFENALVKYGWDSFEVEILEIILDFDKSNPKHRELILDKETNYIELYDSDNLDVGYNLCRYSNDRTGVPCSEETKTKMSQASLGKPKSKESVEKMRKSKKGKSNGPHTEESIEKMRQSKLGKKRKPFSEEAKSNMSKAQRGRVLSEETRMKMSLASKGKPKSKEHVEKMREASTGKVASKETKMKMSESHKGFIHTEESKEKLRQINIGRKMSPEARENMRKARLAYVVKQKLLTEEPNSKKTDD